MSTTFNPENDNGLILEAKNNLKKVLRESGYLTDNPNVVQAVEELSSLWKQASASISEPVQEESSTSSSGMAENQVLSSPARSPLMFGQWKNLSAPQFPGRIINENDPDKYQYTLGRISFNLFQPKDLICTLNKVTNVVQEMEAGDKGEKRMTYSFVMDLTILTDHGDLPAELVMGGSASPQSDSRCAVAFTTGEMKKGKAVDSTPDLKQRWDAVFGGAYTQAAKTRGYLESIMMWMLKTAFKMEMPSDASMKYEMKRTMHGYVDVLYLDEDFRVTRGNRGTLVIVEKQTE